MKTNFKNNYFQYQLKSLSNLLLIAPIVLGLSACATFNPKDSELLASPACQVWTTDFAGIKRLADFHEGNSRQQIKCWVMDMFACSYNTYSVKAVSQEIESSALGIVGKLESKKMSYKITGSTSDSIDLSKNPIVYQVTPLIGGKQSKTLNHNNKCTDKDLALGVMALVQY